MLTYAIVLGFSAIVLATCGYIPYVRNMLARRTTPHAFSWLVWAILAGIGFAAQYVEGAGPGAWVTGFSALVCCFIFTLAFVRGTREFPLIDWFCLGAAGIAIALWAYTHEPVGAVVLITLADMLGFAPTFRKAYADPHGETLSVFACSGIAHALGLLALEAYTVATWLYPASLVLTNATFVAMVVLRRKRFARHGARVRRHALRP